MVFKFLFFSLKTKKTRKLELLVFMVFRGIIFWYKFCARTVRLLFLYYNLIFNLYEFTLPL